MTADQSIPRWLACPDNLLKSQTFEFRDYNLPSHCSYNNDNNNIMKDSFGGKIILSESVLNNLGMKWINVNNSFRHINKNNKNNSLLRNGLSNWTSLRVTERGRECSDSLGILYHRLLGSGAGNGGEYSYPHLDMQSKFSLIKIFLSVASNRNVVHI